MSMSLFDRYLQESDAFSAKNKTPELSRTQRFFKIFLVAVNLVLLIFACVLMGVGSVAYTKGVGPLSGQTIPQGIIALGVFIMFLSFAGCFGAWKENKHCLGFYFLFLLLFTIMLFAIGIGVVTKKNEASAYMQSGWISLGYSDRNSFQQTFGCCGLNYYNDQYSAFNPNPPPTGYPCPTNTTSNRTDRPCLPQLVSSFNSSYNTLGITGIVLAIFMLLFMIVSCRLIRAVRQKAEVAAAADTEKIETGDDSAAPSSDQP